MKKKKKPKKKDYKIIDGKLITGRNSQTIETTIDQIVFITSSGICVEIHSAGRARPVVLESSMDAIANDLGSNFLQADRFHIVNMTKVLESGATTLMLEFNNQPKTFKIGTKFSVDIEEWLKKNRNSK